MLTRQQRRQVERQQTKTPQNVLSVENFVKSRTYTYDEMVKFAVLFHQEQVESAKKKLEEYYKQEMKKVKDNFDKVYVSVFASALASEKFKFGRKRIGKALELVFEQLQAIKENALDIETLEMSANTLGITFGYNEDGDLEINIDNEARKTDKPTKTLVI